MLIILILKMSLINECQITKGGVMDKSRQQFEEEMAETMDLDINEIIRHRDGDKYQSLTVSVAWHWWQASRESLINSLQPDAVIYRYSNKTNFSFEKSKFNELIQQGFIPLYRLDK